MPARIRRKRRMRRAIGRLIPADPSGSPAEMKAIGESLSGTQPEIGHKHSGIGSRVREGTRRRSPRRH